MTEESANDVSSPNLKGNSRRKKNTPSEAQTPKGTTRSLESDDDSESEGEKENNSYLKDNAFNLSQVKINALRMLEDRGYRLDRGDSEIVQMKPETLSRRLDLLKMNKSYEHETENKSLHLIFLSGGVNQTINKPIIQKLLSSLSKQKPKVLVIIGDAPLGAKAVDKLLERGGASGSWFIQFFRLEELLYRPIDHGWCPIYVKLSEEEKINLRRNEGISLANLALLRYADLSDLKAEKDKDKFFIDPICKYYELKPDDIVKEIGVNVALNYLCPVYLLYRRVGR